MKKYPHLVTLLVLSLCPILSSLSAAEASPSNEPSRYNIVWDTPSKDAFGSVPLGNGDIGINAWVQEGDDLLFYIGKTDTWGDNSRLLKVGRVRVKLSPNPFLKGNAYQQILDLKNGELSVQAKFKDGTPISMKVWVDANHPVIRVSMNSQKEVEVTTSSELWRTTPTTIKPETGDPLNKTTIPTVVEPDTLLKDQKGRIGWYHHNKKSFGPDMTMKKQGLADFKYTDSILHRTFGVVIEASSGMRASDTHLKSPLARKHHINLYVLTTHPSTPAQWLASMNQLIVKTQKTPIAESYQNHKAWWQSFWKRSWIHLEENANPSSRMSILVSNKFPLMIGRDQNGNNGFTGNIGRVSVIRRVLSDDDIKKLANDQRKKLHGKDVQSWNDVKLGANHKNVKLDGELTLEAWIKPDNTSNGRILDKITAGGSDGFLLDLQKGKVRFINGKSTTVAKTPAVSGRWQHVAVTITRKQSTIFIDGVKQESSPPQTSQAFKMARGYQLQRYIIACAGRGAYPIKFNGSIFTIAYPNTPGDADYRRWGTGYWWQNTRLSYIGSCASGDTEMMRPLFDMYTGEFLELCKYRTRKYMGHGGAFFPECVYPWGAVFTQTYGPEDFETREDKLQTSGWHKWEWICGGELVYMMLDYYEHTGNIKFLNEKVLPTAMEVMKFFDEHYKTNAAGKLVMHPAMACETWWDCTNPMPELAGLYALTQRLLDLPDGLLSAERTKFCTSLRKKLPPLPTRKVGKGGKQLAYAPATKFADKRNVENPELYVVFPYRLCSFEKKNVELGRQALKHRWARGAKGWRQDDLFMAYLGLADEAWKTLASRASHYDRRHRFPAFWGPNYDWTPDQDHGGVLVRGVQAMIMQTEGKKIFLNPALPKHINADFKLHAPYQTVVTGRIINGKVIDLKVTPESRRADVLITQ